MTKFFNEVYHDAAVLDLHSIRQASDQVVNFQMEILKFLIQYHEWNNILLFYSNDKLSKYYSGFKKILGELRESRIPVHFTKLFKYNRHYYWFPNREKKLTKEWVIRNKPTVIVLVERDRGIHSEFDVLNPMNITTIRFEGKSKCSKVLDSTMILIDVGSLHSLYWSVIKNIPKLQYKNITRSQLSLESYARSLG
eukprot:TCONS_00000943-protein